MTAKFKAGDILIVLAEPKLRVHILEVKAHTYRLMAVNYPAAQNIWELEWKVVEEAFRKPTKLDKALA